MEGHGAMSRTTVNESTCIKDYSCVAVCPTGTLGINDRGFPEEVSEATCISCGHCMAVCSTGAIEIDGLPVEEFESLPAAMAGQKELEALMKSRRSIRVFRDKPVSAETIEALLEIARRAPSAKNSQLLHWIVVNGKEKVRALARETIEGLLPASARPALVEMWESGADRLLRGAPAVVLACAPAKFSWGADDAVIALSYLELAAAARGLGVCWAGYLKLVAASHQPVQDMLNVPEGYVVRGALMLGESKFRYRRIPPRKPASVSWI